MQGTLDVFLRKQQKIVDPNATTFTCDYCHSVKKKMTIWKHTSGVILCLCFLGCQHFPEPYRKAVTNENPEDWTRIDRFQNYHKTMNYGRSEE